MSNTTHPHLRRLVGAALAVVLVGGLAACGSADADTKDSGPSKDGVTTVNVAGLAGPLFTATSLKVDQVDAIRKELPKSVLDSGTLTIGVGALPAGFPPLVLTGTDQKTLTGSEPDLGRLVAAVLGLKPVINNATWENLFIGITGGRSDVGFSNITDTEERKLKYDFASYRNDNLGLEVNKDSVIAFDGKYQNLAGLSVAVSSGTNQEKLLLEWKKKLAAAGKSLDIKYYPTQNAVNLALASNKIDAYFGPNPGIQYHISQSAKSANPTRSAGTFSGAGETLQGLIAATTTKGNGLIKPIQDAINHLIDNGQYAKWLKAYNLSNESVSTSELNPPGLPLSNS